ncbi:hypothetical protein UlMin_021628 [Ulmus minor]
MRTSLIFAHVCTLKSSNKPGAFIRNLFPGKVVQTNELFLHPKAGKFQSLEVKAAENNQSTKPNKQGTKPNSIVNKCIPQYKVDNYRVFFLLKSLCYFMHT